MSYPDLNKYLQDHLQATYGDYKKDKPRSAVSRALFYARRKSLGVTGRVQEVSTKYETVDTFIKANPEASYVGFRAEHPTYPCKEWAFYKRKKRIVGRLRFPRKSVNGRVRNYTKVYTSIWSADQASVEKAPIVLTLQDIFDALNKNCKTQIEAVIISGMSCQPDRIEVRRLTR